MKDKKRPYRIMIDMLNEKDFNLLQEEANKQDRTKAYLGRKLILEGLNK